MRTERYRGIFLSILIVTSLVSILSLSLSSQTIAGVPDVYISHAPIVINGDAGFTSPDPVNGGGSGTIGDPYIIENYAISAAASKGIDIQNTTAYFVIRDCLVENGASSANQGIYFLNVVNGTIYNNTLINTYNIYIDQADYISITNNTVKNGLYGIYLRTLCDYDNVTNNTIDNLMMGVYMYQTSTYNNVTNNTIPHRSRAVYIRTGCDYNTVENNTCSGGSYGLYLQGSYLTVTNNTCENSSSYGIYLSGSNYDNVINNTVKNMGDTGIYLRNTSYINVIGNSVENCTDYGFQIDTSSYDNVISNTCDNSGRGIGFDTASYENVTGNSSSNNSDYGIYIIRSPHNNLTNNTCDNNDGPGIYLYYTGTDYNTLTNNSCSNNTTGIEFYRSTYTTLTNNTCDNNVYNLDVGGNAIEHWDHNIDNSNLVNGKPIYYIKDTSDLVIGSDIGYLGLVRCNNITVENVVLEPNGQGILLVQTNNSSIENCDFSNSHYAIYLWGSSYDNLTNNNCSNSYDGVYMYSSTNNNVTGNTIENSRTGVYMYSSSNYNNITSNIIKNCSYASIMPTSSSNNINVTNNICEDTYLGMYFNNSSNGNIISNTCSGGMTGIYLASSSNNNTVENNTCTNMTRAGIYAPTAPNNTIRKNTLENNENGIYITTGSGNSIYHNNFINNVQQAYNTTGANTWDDGYPSGGNYWSDHTTPDENSGPNQDIPGSDGIVDTPYPITGGANQDRYPLVTPWVATCGVDVTIENALLEGSASQWLEYTINVHNSGNIEDNFSLSYIPDGWPDIYIDPPVLENVPPFENMQATLFAHVPENAVPCTYKEITVVAESQFCSATDNDTATAHVQQPCGVDVTIENALLEGYGSQVLEYTIDVHNSGNIEDNFSLSYIPDGWPDISIDPLVLIDVMPSEHRQATMYVHVPDGAIGCTYKEITVVAESQFCGATDNDTATAHVQEVCGVDVTIENALLEGYPSQWLEYTIDFHNAGNVVDNIILSFVPDGWPDIYIDPPVLIDVAPCEWRQATLYVHVPDNAVPCTYKDITVVAESQFCGATDNDTAQALATGEPVVTYTYVSSYSAVKGTVTDFANQQSADDGGAYSTLAEESATGSGLDYLETFEHGGAIPDGWTFLNNFGIKSTGTGNHTPGGTYSAGITAGANQTNVMTSCVIDYTGKTNVHVNFWCRGTATSAGSWVKVDASIDGGSTWTVPVMAQVGIPGDSTHHQYFDDQDLSSLAGQSNVKFRWTVFRTGGYINIDDIQFTADGATTIEMEIYENISGIPSADTQTLEMRYELANTNDNFNVQVWDGLAWNTRGDTLDSTSWTDWSYTLLGSEVISGTVQVRFIDVNPSSTAQDNILKDYLRVKSEAEPYYGVDVTIVEDLLEGWPSLVLEYTIDVHNSGNAVDNIYLSYIPDGWPDITIVPQVLTDVAPCEHRQATMYVHVPDNAVPCTYKEIIVIAETEFCHVTDNDSTQAHVIVEPVCGVDVTIVENLLEGCPSQVLEFTIDVHNTGNIVDNFSLSYIPDGWPDISIDPLVLTDVAPCEHKQATMYVHVPDNAVPCTYKEIIVIAESEFCHITDNDNAQAHAVAIIQGTAVFSLKNLYTVNVEKILEINLGSKLVVKFYTYGDGYENENVIETFTPPWQVEENELARHPGAPGRVGVKKARLDLTTNDTENVIATVASFTVTKTMLELRFTQIPLEWALAGTPEEKTALEIEFSEVPLYWALALS